MPHEIIIRVIVFLFGPSGSGKTVLGESLSNRLSFDFLEADDFHPQENIEKMKRGEPLTDHDRMPWLALLKKQIKNLSGKKPGIVVACSALKKSYRDFLDDGIGKTKWIYLSASRSTLQYRMENRTHFMPPALLESQLKDLELAGDARISTVKTDNRSIEEIVHELERIVTDP